MVSRLARTLDVVACEIENCNLLKSLDERHLQGLVNLERGVSLRAAKYSWCWDRLDVFSVEEINERCQRFNFQTLRETLPSTLASGACKRGSEKRAERRINKQSDI